MSQPNCARQVDGFAFTWPDLPLTVTLTRIRDGSRGVQAELIAQYVNGTGKAKTLLQRSINLLTNKTLIAKELQAKHDAPWTGMLDQACMLALRELRQGEPIESLEPTESDGPAWFVLNPLLYDKNPTILYGPGDSMKSALALYCGMLLASGISGPNLAVAPTPRKVLFLDWEMSVQDLRGRTKLFRAADRTLTATPEYRRCYQPLADEIGEVKKVVMEGEYDVLIVDSLAMAAGGQELERADSAIRFNAALRSLNCTSLIIGHTPKPQEGQTERSLYGSVFFHNLCRVSWECRREGQTLGLYQRKNNLGPKHDPIGFQFDMTEEACTVGPAELHDDPVLSKGLRMVDRAAHVLKAEPGKTVKELAGILEEKEASLRTMLNRWTKRFISVDGKWECLA